MDGTCAAIGNILAQVCENTKDTRQTQNIYNLCRKNYTLKLKI